MVLVVFVNIFGSFEWFFEKIYKAMVCVDLRLMFHNELN